MQHCIKLLSQPSWGGQAPLSEKLGGPWPPWPPPFLLHCLINTIGHLLPVIGHLLQPLLAPCSSHCNFVCVLEFFSLILFLFSLGEPNLLVYHKFLLCLHVVNCADIKPCVVGYGEEEETLTPCIIRKCFSANHQPGLHFLKHFTGQHSSNNKVKPTSQNVLLCSNYTLNYASSSNV